MQTKHTPERDQQIIKNIIASVVVTVAAYSLPAIADNSSSQSIDNTLSKQVLERSNIVSDFTALIDKHFNSTPTYLLDELNVTSDSNQNPHINIEANELVLPYHYLSYAIKNHATLEETKEAALERGINTVEYTLYHLFGHYIAQDNSSDSDDIAEAVSSWLMIKGFRNGGEQWFANAEAFGRASQLLDGPLEDYWHEHALYKSRQQQINCWILGSAPARYEHLLKPVLEPQQRAQRCIKEWDDLDAQMQALLQDNLVTDSTLLKK